MLRCGFSRRAPQSRKPQRLADLCWLKPVGPETRPYPDGRKTVQQQALSPEGFVDVALGAPT